MSNNWNGVGLPPEGTICLGHCPDLLNAWGWHRVEVYKTKKDECAVCLIDIGILRWCDEFKPIKSDRDKAVEDMYKIWESICHSSDGSFIKSYTEELYDAGYRKQSGE